MYNGIKDATWGRPGATRIYYDATFSKMALNGDTDDFSIPKANNNKETIYYRIKGDGVESESGTLVQTKIFIILTFPKDIVQSSFPVMQLTVTMRQKEME